MNAKIINDHQALKDVIELLKSNKLPYQDIELNNNLIISYHTEDGNLIGSGGLEFYASYALLRSLAVDQTQRGKSFGKYIVNDLLDRAKSKSIKSVFLLTETAHDFFLHYGFADVARDSVPGEVRQSSEFKSVCPVSAACMVYHFKN
jgi:amino-acid N-acetyltransferase